MAETRGRKPRFAEPVAVLGLGRFGTAVALELAERGIEVLAVDADETITQRLAGRLSSLVSADTTDPDVLREIGIPEFTRCVVGIGTDQQASILTVAALSDLGIENIWAKALNTQHARILQRVGAHHVVLPENDMGERVAHLVSGRMLDYVEVDADWAIVRTVPPGSLVGVSLGESRPRTHHRIAVISVKPPGAAGFAHANAQTVLTEGDEILIAGTVADVEAFSNLP